MRLLFVLLLLGGCASHEPYAELQLSYTLNSSHYALEHGRPWQCEPPGFTGRVGMETPNGWQYGLEHNSTVLCGWPNSKPELFSDQIFVGKKWGGQ